MKKKKLKFDFKTLAPCPVCGEMKVKLRMAQHIMRKVDKAHFDYWDATHPIKK